ncbi:citrate lyase subunit gamma (acyl carrier protein) [Anaerosphaera aminiphila DSM 21120]|uniref:Citrate lyase acyl carrier protein n=1 Tax=Anaerosphaera aminiphila DSM 21120 TaxID=1120995 RepID=A0A1M5UUF9_9FIRM|nr:citrate lyase acyl carrier protein [Anaerosphaera aminiphila]SHH66611.1 citrate lyase subunit gamma (acyl carrier protein) [Anaerosphaera aminiphila DSM 21120]
METLKIKKEAVAGTVESNDILITIGKGSGINIDLQSSVKKQFGRQIENAIKETLEELNITDVNVKAIDKGALDYVIKARTKTCIYRACKVENYEWSE